MPTKVIHYDDDSHLSIARIRCGKHGFYYRYRSGKKVTGKRVLNRIKKLVIPPNWQNTYISDDSKASLQAVGYDNKNRRQYIYHPLWHKQQQVIKFSRLKEFGRKLPAFRKRCVKLLASGGWHIDKACALVCLLLDYTGARVGNSQYSKQNATYGLTTLRRKHIAKQEQANLRLSYTGKHGKPRLLMIDDPELAKLVNECAEQQGYCLFRYQSADKRWHDVTSEDVNHFIHREFAPQFSCKDFRTWASSRYALLKIPEVIALLSASKTRTWESSLSKLVSKELGNTPTVCRQYYIHPQLFTLQHSDALSELVSQVKEIKDQGCTSLSHLEPIEKRLLEVIS
ncbi:DNA topoisomerase IB [Alteromonas sp. C1M14]|uniref:DNA topoisomerase IB n=1 Tax=Alteromonas sp. C1M14 TaxID=2841567 RepID=UPI001C08CE20|nr:DNA topoisomerase IB [Alteromonas sp. C1M14]MBU2979310.1 DNA topoisomerase IB [Alteromonas sp. C1M14]